MSDDPVAHLKAIVGRLEWQREASNVLVSVRRIDESDMSTLKRVVSDYQKIKELLRACLPYPEYQRIDDLYPGALPDMIEGLIMKGPIPEVADKLAKRKKA